MSILVIDVGTSGVRTLVVRPDGSTIDEHHLETLPASPQPGLVEFDPVQLVVAARALARRTLVEAGDVQVVGVTNQRASTVLWDSRTGEPLGPGLGWQDLRTVGRCLELRAAGIDVAPNQTATKAEWLIQQTDVDAPYLRIGTVDAWMVWHLSHGQLHVTDSTNAGVTGLYDTAADDWDHARLDALGIPVGAMPEIVDSVGLVGGAVDLDGAPPIGAMAGDQQASLVGQGCIEPGQAKITFGTGAMLDLVLSEAPPRSMPSGTFPIVAWRRDRQRTFGIEAVMLAAGSAVEWLRDGIGLIDTVEESADVAASVDDTGGVVFVPALSGLGSPDWDHGARGLLVGATRGTTRAHVVRAVLEGVAHRGADLVEAAEAATGTPIADLRVDGGMTRNPVFLQALADATQRTIEVSAEREATALGAGLLAGVAAGIWPDLASATAARRSPDLVEPSQELDRARFADARSRARGWIPALSDLDL